ncbi:glucose-6-phosphate dehydrogenase [Lottiidibacillus patelloidae]|uniref:Glucose-6-phosphate 1-dehydrogenase n=1 Tax=Lottiidibacillus patelloidae TaxID=2670334 RepID=A0A263BR83_9BACI|nr:glucose-6-phosphate dehydrogenase [Lottiidibacillus patelloidae]
MNNKPKNIVVIFGATGDLAKRKLYPSIYNLFKKNKIGEEFAVVGVARSELTNEAFRENVISSVTKNVALEDRKNVEKFSEHFFYLPFDVTKPTSYEQLNHLLTDLEGRFEIPGNRLFYLAMAPEFFGTIAQNLKAEGVTNTDGWTRLVIEKPFGHDLPSAQKLNDEIREAFAEEDIYRIDHYLGKSMVQNIEVIRFANAIFEPLWNSRYISNIQVTSSETLGVEDRGKYYEKSGALRDMVQNHMLQMVALLAMEPPISLTDEEIRSEKIKVLRAMRPLTEEDVNNTFVRGQYGPGVVKESEVKGYREENNVDENSNTETFVSGKIFIDNFRWAGVPFFIRTGKRMALKSTKIVVQFKDLPMNLYAKKGQKNYPNLLVINIQPDEGITLIMNGKKIGPTSETTRVSLDYSNDHVNDVNTPEAYERLVFDCMLGDATNFTHWDEVSLSWSYVDAISKVWESNKEKNFPNYEAGSMGPKDSDRILDEEGFHWWPIVKNEY